MYIYIYVYNFFTFRPGFDRHKKYSQLMTDVQTVIAHNSRVTFRQCCRWCMIFKKDDLNYVIASWILRYSLMVLTSLTMNMEVDASTIALVWHN